MVERYHSNIKYLEIWNEFNGSFADGVLTYRDQRLKGSKQLFIGLFSFYTVCSLGVVANLGIVNYVFTNLYSWWLSGIARVIIGAVWNYAATPVFTWRVAK